MYSNDKRTVLTLDAGGTNFVFSAICGNREIVDSVHYKADPDNLSNCLQILIQGFEGVKKQLTKPAVAISFAFPGPADYRNGIIGDLPNFPAFKNGVALGPLLQKHFNLPVFINNDGNLFAYGEALAGSLPEINRQLEISKSKKRYKNLLGITLGTGFGGGVVIDGRLLTGDNGGGGDVWCFRNKKFPSLIAEESVSIRAVKRVYKELTQYENTTGKILEPVDIFHIAEGKMEGDRDAAIRSFQELGEVAGDVIAQASIIVDGIVVIGGGIAGASKYILPSLVKEMNSRLNTFENRSFPRMSMKAYNLESEMELNEFLKDKNKEINIPLFEGKAIYNHQSEIGVMISGLGVSKAVALGAYAFALANL